MIKGSKVKHWFAGFGIVERVINKTTCYCKWNDGTAGIAYIRDLVPGEG